MYRGSTVAVVVPAYNEEGFVGEVIDTVPEYVDRVYVIDDASTDATWQEINEHVDDSGARAPQTVTDGGAGTVAENAGAVEDEPRAVEDERSGTLSSESGTVTDERAGFDQRVVPIQHDRNRGVGGSIKTGYRHALADGIDVTAVMNGDGQMDPDRLESLLDPIVTGKADYAKGNRLLFRNHREGMSTWRLFGNAVLTGFTKIASGYWKTMDSQNGYTAISKTALQRLSLPDLYEDYGFCNDLLVRLNAHDMRVADVLMPAVYGDEESSIRYSTFVPGLSYLLLRDFLWRMKVKYLLFDFHPLVLFYFLGATGVVLGSAVVGWAALAEPTPAAGALALLTVIVSIMSIGFAMVFDMRQNADLEVQIRD